MAVITQIQLRRGTAAVWTANNPTLAAGEFGFETDTRKAKIGDGVTAWNSLAYALTGATGTVTSVASGTGITGGPITSTGTLSIDTAVVATLTGTQTLTNKTLNLTPTAGTSSTSGVLNVGTNSFADTGVLATFQSSIAGYNQVTVQNTSNNSAASAEFIAYNDQGTASTNYAALGINSSTYSGTGALNAPGYGFYATASTDMAIGTFGNNALHFVTNSSATDAMTISAAGAVTVTNTLTAGAYKGAYLYNINAQTGTTFTPALSDNAAIVTLTNASAIALTIPPNSSVAYPVGSQINFIQGGSGQVTISGGSGVTIASTGVTAASPKLRVQYSSASAIKVATDTWYVIGDIA
jgi:hypothetical protein